MRKSFVGLGNKDEEWPEVWRTIESSGGATGTTFGEALKSGILTTLILRLFTVGTLARPLMAVWIAFYLWFLNSAATGGSPLALFQFSMVAGFIVGWTVYVNYTVVLRGPIRVLRDEELPAEFREAARALDVRQDANFPDLSEFEGREFKTKFSASPDYIRSVRQYYSKWLTLNELVLDVPVLGLLVLVTFGIGSTSSKLSDDRLNSWGIRTIVGIALLPFVVGAAVWLALLILQNFRRFKVLLATAFVLAIVPPLLTLLVQGKTGANVVPTSLISAAVGCLGATVADLFKEDLSEKA